MNIKAGVSGTKIIKAADKGVLGACIGSIAAVYVLDIIFFAAWAPELYLIPVFILIGAVIRTTAVFGGVVLQWVRGRNDIRLARATVRILWVLCLIACIIPALSFFAGGHKSQTQGADVAVATGAASTGSQQTRIDQITLDIETLEAERDAAVEEVNGTINAIVDDGVPGISEADNRSIENLRNEIKDIRGDYRGLIAAKRTERDGIEQEKGGVAVQTAEAETEVNSFYAVFVVIDEVAGGGADNWALRVLFYFAILIELISWFGLGAYYDIHRVFVKLIREVEAEDVEADSPVTEDDEAGEAPANDPEPAEDEHDPNIPLTPEQVGQLGAAAREHYKEALQAGKIEIPPPEEMTNRQMKDAA